MDTLSRRGRAVRVVVTAIAAVLLLAGTLWGVDDDFPFGPFRMYATRDDPNGAVTALRVEAVDATGRVLVLSDHATGLRRAEIEGQAGRLVADPALLGQLSLAHDRRHPSQPPYDLVRVVASHTLLHDSRPTGRTTSSVLVTWTRP
jgi:hypothetical protein